MDKEKHCQRAILDGYAAGAIYKRKCEDNPFEQTGNIDEHWFWKEGWCLGDKHRIEIAILMNSVVKLMS